MMRSLFFLLLITQLAGVVRAQNEATPFQDLALQNLSSFQATTDNWQVVEKITADRSERWAIEVEPGTGVLANIQTEESRGHLFTNFDHADLELDLEVLMPNGSNSGIYFQSRYEIQLLDSWGKKEPQQSDIGGIYQRWDESRPEGERGYEGHAPRVNVARAPGLWQHLNVVFQAPRFDAAGMKTSPARFVSVRLNGVLIHEDVPLSGPTRAAAFEDSEVPAAPLMIQGDHGPVAFRNIRYRKFDAAPVTLSNLTYNYYRGDFPHQMPALDELSLVRSEQTDAITSEKADTTKLFALRFEGDIDVPRTGTYTFEVVHSARFRLEIDGAALLSDQEGEEVSKVGEFPRRLIQKRLTRGQHSFALTYAKGLWHNVPTALGWYISGPGLLRTQLTASGSVPKDPFSAYRLEVEQAPIIQRNFVMHKDEKRTHAISVGFPGGLHYAYDMGTGALLHLWKGSFIDTSTMWYQRGQMQSAVPLGSLIERAGNQTVFTGGSEAMDTGSFVFKNYRLAGAGYPVYQYEVDGLFVTDEIAPDAESRFFIRTITIEGDADGRSVWCLLAESDEIEAAGDGLYLVDGQKIYIETSAEAKIEVGDEHMRLVAPVKLENGNAVIQSHLVW